MGKLIYLSYVSGYKCREMSNGIGCLNALKNLVVSDLLRIKVQTCDGD